jgi:hypothetical protein
LGSRWMGNVASTSAGQGVHDCHHLVQTTVLAHIKHAARLTARREIVRRIPPGQLKAFTAFALAMLADCSGNYSGCTFVFRPSDPLESCPGRWASPRKDKAWPSVLLAFDLSCSSQVRRYCRQRTEGLVLGEHQLSAEVIDVADLRWVALSSSDSPTSCRNEMNSRCRSSD